jgi:hypothetical protein
MGEMEMTHSIPRSRIPIKLALTTLACALSTAALAAQPAPKTQLPQQVLQTGAEDAPAAAAAPAATSTFARQATVVDRTTQLQNDLIRMTSRSSVGLVAVKGAGRSVRVNLDGRFMSVAVATPTADGHYKISCDSGPEALEKVKQAQAMSAGKLPKLDASSVAKPQTTATAALEEK